MLLFLSSIQFKRILKFQKRSVAQKHLNEVLNGHIFLDFGKIFKIKNLRAMIWLVMNKKSHNFNLNRWPKSRF